jgi:hypothetical protein
VEVREKWQKPDQPAAAAGAINQGELVTEEMSANPIFSNSVKLNQIHN